MDLVWFPQHASITARLGENAPSGWAGELGFPYRGIDLRKIRAVYYRRPRDVQVSGQLAPHERVVAAHEARLGVGGLLCALPGVYWLPHPAQAQFAEYKPVQLAAARRAGLVVPDTIITNDPDQARQFAERHGWQVVYKTLGPVCFTIGGKTLTTYTTPVTPKVLAGEEIRHTAHLFQRQVDKACDVRLVVTAERMFGIEIHSPQLDWRLSHDANQYRICEVPAEVATSVRALLDGLGLEFCAADFAVDHHGTGGF